ncbi:MAG: hypothetical protein ACR2HN_04095 [Tepidiformaceae bacterium]
MKTLLRTALNEGTPGGEDGHWVPFLAAVLAAAGALVLSIGAANDSGLWAIIGGIVVAVGFLAYDIARHMTVDYDFYRRFDSPK